MATRLTKKEKGFAKDFMDTGNGTKAILNNYDTDNYDTASVMASQNLRKLRIQEYIATHAEEAESMIYKLSQTSEQDMVRLNASKDIMDRAGFKPTEKSETRNLNVEVKLENKDLEVIREKYEEEIKSKLIDETI